MKRQIARVIYPDGTDTLVNPKDGKKFSLKELQGLVEGYIELIYLPPGNGHNQAYVNEEGKLKGLPLNRKATEIYGRWPADGIVGNLVIVTRER